MEAMRKKAMECASSWNASFNKERQTERKSYVDIQTMTVQSASKRPKLLDKCTDFGSYPVALMPGQYQNYYRSYNATELAKLPLRTITDPEEHIPRKRFEDVADQLLEEPREPGPNDPEASNQSAPDAGEELPTPGDLAPENDRGEDTGEHCAFCRKDLFSKDRYVECAQCSSAGHPSCLDMTDKMFEVVKGYAWECMECKPCSVCSNLDNEEKMLFCDNCDRGYHTFCVGLSDLPSGTWHCKLFCASVRSDVGKSVNKSRHCLECRTLITKNNKVHHASKFRASGLCLECASVRKR